MLLTILPLLAAPASAQRISLEARAGVVGSTPLARDAVAVFRSVAGAPVERDITVHAAPAPQVGVALRAGFWPAVALQAAVDWASSDVEVDESAGRRAAGSLTVLQATLGATWRARPRVELGAGAGLIRYDGGPAGFLPESESAGVAQVSVGWVVPAIGDRLTLGLSAQTHRFGTSAIREAGGSDGTVARVALTGSFRIVEVVR